MKLFLVSIVIAETQLGEFSELVGKSLSGIKLALIENAADPYNENSKVWMYENRKTMQSYSFDTEIVDISQYKNRSSELADKLATKDVIWLGGGNTFYLRWLLQDVGADAIITQLVRQGTVYGGGSAGAIVAGPTLLHFETADDPKDAPEVILDGLHFTESVVVPHMDNVKFAPIIHGINQKLKADGYTTVPLNDSQALIVNGDEQRVI